MKNIFAAALVVCGLSVEAQSSAHALYIKANALALPVGMLNAGLEYQLSPKFTLQGDVFISPWKSFAGNHAQVYMGHLEGRYYFSEAFHHWFIGLNAGTGVFDLTKWNYADTDKYQRGYTFMIGASAGYQWQLSERWNMEAFLGVGTAQSFYHGYETIPPHFTKRYDGATDWNKSGEFLPYRGGLMISYKLK